MLATHMKNRTLSQTLKLGFISVAAMSQVLFSTVACQRKCQNTTSATAFKSVTETQWRLVETTDPGVAESLDNFNFLILQFATNGTGAVTRVVNNEQYETPISSILWVPNAKVKQMRIQYTSVPTSNSASAVQSGDLGTFDYKYTLGKQLELYESGSGYYSRYVPFTGVVAPDVECEF